MSCWRAEKRQKTLSANIRLLRRRMRVRKPEVLARNKLSMNCDRRFDKSRRDVRTQTTTRFLCDASWMERPCKTGKKVAKNTRHFVIIFCVNINWADCCCCCCCRQNMAGSSRFERISSFERASSQLGPSRRSGCRCDDQIAYSIPGRYEPPPFTMRLYITFPLFYRRYRCY